MKPDFIRNFSIIAHIDHGKTTLTDQLLLATHNISKRQFHQRLLDSNPIEQERGITIKLAPVRLSYQLSGISYQLNLIDTPGHVDFSYEVSRSLSACEGALLVVDATQGVQAQTIANYDKALEHNLTLIPIVNKIDLNNANPQATAQQLKNFFGFSSQDILFVSAKTGQNIDQIFPAIINRLSPPKIDSPTAPLKALIFNSTFHSHKGVVIFIKVISGALSQSDLHQLFLLQAKQSLTAIELGYFDPQMHPVESLQAGEVGYVATGLKDIHKVRVGDTLTHQQTSTITPIPGYQPPQPMVFLDLYPIDADDYHLLQKSLAQLALNDAALTYQATASPALGNGFRVGFLGILHAEIVTERLEREFNLSVITTTPSVPYRLTLTNNQQLLISSPTDFPDPSQIKTIEEPIVSLTLYTPETYLGKVMQLCEHKRS